MPAGRPVRGAWIAAAPVTGVLVALVVLDITDRPIRHWFVDHAFTTAVVSGVLVLLVTVLIVDRLIDNRQLKDRSRVIAAQVAIVNLQAKRANDALSAALDGSGERDGAGDEIRTFMTMLLDTAPLLIDGSQSRVFLEAGQRLAAEMARALTATGAGEPTAALKARRRDAVARLKTAAQPLLQILNLEQRRAIDSDDSESTE